MCQILLPVCGNALYIYIYIYIIFILYSWDTLELYRMNDLIDDYDRIVDERRPTVRPFALEAKCLRRMRQLLNIIRHAASWEDAWTEVVSYVNAVEEGVEP